MTFPLCHRPGGIIFLDDDPDYLEMLAEVIPSDWYVRLFLSPLNCIKVLQEEPQQWSKDAGQQQEVVTHWRNGQSLLSHLLDYWCTNGTARFALTQVCVVDYSMPSMSGLRFLSEIVDWSGARIMLTGRADAQLGVSAFNRGLIDRFIPKQSPAIRLRLLETIEGLRNQPNSRHHHIWHATLKPAHNAWLAMPTVDAGLSSLAQKYKWVEHIVIGHPFGVVGLDAKGQASWLQLTAGEDLEEMANQAQAAGVAQAEVADIRAGKKLTDAQLQQALGVKETPQTQEATALSGEVPGSTAPRLYAALFMIDPARCPGPTRSYGHFLAEFGQRDILN